MENEQHILFTSEFIKFAKDISVNLKHLSPGNYFDDNKKYHVELFSSFTDCHFITMYYNPVKTDARVGNTSQKIQISLERCKEYTENYLFYMMLWCRAAMVHKGDTLLCDKLALEYYSRTGRRSLDVLKGLAMTMQDYLGHELYMQRNKQILEILGLPVCRTRNK